MPRCQESISRRKLARNARRVAMKARLLAEKDEKARLVTEEEADEEAHLEKMAHDHLSHNIFLDAYDESQKRESLRIQQDVIDRRALLEIQLQNFAAQLLLFSLYDLRLYKDKLKEAAAIMKAINNREACIDFLLSDLSDLTEIKNFLKFTECEQSAFKLQVRTFLANNMLHERRDFPKDFVDRLAIFFDCFCQAKQIA